VPDVSWEDIGALQNVREELKTAILVRNIAFTFMFISYLRDLYSTKRHPSNMHDNVKYLTLLSHLAF